MRAAVPELAERRAALISRVPVWEPVTLDGLLARAAAEHGDRPLVLTDERTLSYADAAAWAGRLGEGLRALGVQPGDRVGLLMANHLEFVPLKFAVAAAGAVAIPFNFLYRAQELAWVLRQSGCTCLITMTGHAALDYPAMLDEVAPGWEDGATPELPDLRWVVQLETGAVPARDGVRTTADLEALAPRSPPPGPARSPLDVGDILYTSGTTGSPKGVCVTHDAVARTGYASALTRAMEDGRRIVFSLPCYHMFGYVEGLIAALWVGGAIIPRLAFDPADQFAAMERHAASDLLCVPTMTIALLEHAGRRRTSVFSLLSGAAAGPAWLWRRAAEELGITEIVTGYGMTETGGAMTLTLPEDPPERHAETVGRPKLAGAAGVAGGALCTYLTADPLTGERLPEGAEGELISTGPTQMVGFWENADATAQALRGGWVFSGDLGRLDEAGYLRVTGRSKELYKSGGELVMPKEVEATLSEHPGVSQVYAIGVPDDRWGEAGCAWIVPEQGVELDADELIALCRERLARFKVPKHVLFTTADELPTTPTGKVQKFKLLERAAERLQRA